MSELADIAVIGLAVMGQNIILNMDEQGFKVCAFNRTVSKIHDFLANEAKGTRIVGAFSAEELAKKLARPRRILLLVRAGDAVDAMIGLIAKYLEKGDIIIDGGNSSYTDTERRCEELAAKGIHFVGMGISGGEEGARHGPSLMPGGAEEAWPFLQNLLCSISAKVGDSPCCDWVMGPGGSGHFVKMVHNGIEYGDMQLITEAYHLLRDAVGLDHDEMANIFDSWNDDVLDSYLIKITADILRFKDLDGQTLLPKILDTAGQKGTGKWTSFTALDHGIPVTLIAEAVFARFLSALKDERTLASNVLPMPKIVDKIEEKDKAVYIEHIKKALYASKIVSYAQGFMLLDEASRFYNWNLNNTSIAMIWRNGCIIRSRFLNNIGNAFSVVPPPQNLLLDPFFCKAIASCQDSWRVTCAKAVMLGIPTPAITSALAFFDGYRQESLPSNLIQAQRDYFGAHTYELISNPGTFVHTNWTGSGGRVTANFYEA
ncbi:unnamed protein product [Dracunculus medinensis]|uniref:6-phosphogluconate dehydrogenase, decarboxylating n=1 Tax=Dracunculus medinensis TaxID=318479 RepID=A0A0N4U4J6_DRAME|nr:unnamed protein product [Dracunculus medinensis]